VIPAVPIDRPSTSPQMSTSTWAVVASTMAAVQSGGISSSDVGPNRELVSGRFASAALSARLTPANTSPMTSVVATAKASDAPTRRFPMPTSAMNWRLMPRPENQLVANSARAHG